MVGTICDQVATISVLYFPRLFRPYRFRLGLMKSLEFSPETYRAGEPDRNRELLLLGGWLNHPLFMDG